MPHSETVLTVCQCELLMLLLLLPLVLLLLAVVTGLVVVGSFDWFRRGLDDVGAPLRYAV